jgi:hypothetical protein
MSDAPKRIWVDGKPDWDTGGWGHDQQDGDAEYVRADLIDTAAIREAVLRDALATVQWLKDEFEAGGAPTAGRVLGLAMERIEALIGEPK